MLDSRTAVAWGGLDVRRSLERFQDSRRKSHESSLDRRLRFFLRRRFGGHFGIFGEYLPADVKNEKDDDWDFYSVTLAFRQTTGNKADGGQ